MYTSHKPAIGYNSQASVCIFLITVTCSFIGFRTIQT